MQVNGDGGWFITKVLYNPKSDLLTHNIEKKIEIILRYFIGC
jgi:hypothetical protein